MSRGSATRGCASSTQTEGFTRREAYALADRSTLRRQVFGPIAPLSDYEEWMAGSRKGADSRHWPSAAQYRRLAIAVRGGTSPNHAASLMGLSNGSARYAKLPLHLR